MSHVPEYIQIGVNGKKTATAVWLGCNMIRTSDVSSMWWRAPLCTRNHPPFEALQQQKFCVCSRSLFLLCDLTK